MSGNKYNNRVSMRRSHGADGRPSWLKMAQDEHDHRHLQLAEQTTSDHFVKVLREPVYWRNVSYQERNNNLLLAETIKLIEQMKDGDIDIIECGIEIGYRAKVQLFA